MQPWYKGTNFLIFLMTCNNSLTHADVGGKNMKTGDNSIAQRGPLSSQYWQKWRKLSRLQQWNYPGAS